MGRYTGPKWKLSRREGMDLFSRGGDALGDSPLTRRNYPPGVHAHRRSKISSYGIRLREKQKLKRIYGVRERQFRGYFGRAAHSPGDTGANLLCLLERRLDSAVTTAGMAKTIPQARQLLVHGHFLVNGQRVDRPSFLLRPGDVIEPREKQETRTLVGTQLDLSKQTYVPAWLEVNSGEMKAKVLAMPTRDEFPYPIVENLIVEFYAK